MLPPRQSRGRFAEAAMTAFPHSSRVLLFMYLEGPFLTAFLIYQAENDKYEIKCILQFSNITAASSLKKEF